MDCVQHNRDTISQLRTVLSLRTVLLTGLSIAAECRQSAIHTLSEIRQAESISKLSIHYKNVHQSFTYYIRHSKIISIMQMLRQVARMLHWRQRKTKQMTAADWTIKPVLSGDSGILARGTLIVGRRECRQSRFTLSTVDVHPVNSRRSPCQRPQVNSDLLVATQHSDGRIEAALRYTNFSPADRFAVSSEENLQNKNEVWRNCIQTLTIGQIKVSKRLISTTNISKAVRKITMTRRLTRSLTN